MPLYLSEEDVASLVTHEDAVASLSEAFASWGMPGTRNLPRQRLHLFPGALNIMAAIDRAHAFFGLKAYFARPEGSGYHVLLYDAENSRLVAMIEANLLSQMRTGAASAFATKLLAREEASVLGLIGTGKQARSQLLALLGVRPISTVLVFSPDPQRREAFANAMREQAGCEIVTVASSAAIAEADIITTITKSATPVIDGSAIRPGTHVNLAGANAPDRREADDDLIMKADVIATDDLAQARVEAGEFIDLAARSALEWDRVAELGDIAFSRQRGRQAASDITVFKSLGIALSDVAFAAAIYRKAMEQGAGRAF